MHRQYALQFWSQRGGGAGRYVAVCMHACICVCVVCMRLYPTGMFSKIPAISEEEAIVLLSD